MTRQLIAPVNFRRTLTRAVLLPSLLMVILSGALLSQVSYLLSVTRWVEYTDQIIARTYQTEKLIVDAETGLRGYLLTGETDFLQPYNQTELKINSSFNQLGRLISHNASQTRLLKEIHSNYDRWELYSRQLIRLRKNNENYQAYSINAQGKEMMDEIREQMALFIDIEQTLRSQRSKAAQNTTVAFVAISIALTLLLASLVAFFVRRQLMKLSEDYEKNLLVVTNQTEALQHSEARFRRLFESNLIGIIFSHLSGRITAANDAFLKIVGYPREDLVLGKLRWLEITPPEYIHLDEQAIVELKVSGVAPPFEKEYIRKDGSRVPILIGAALLEGSEQEAVCFVLELTESKAAEVEIRQLNETLEKRVAERTIKLEEANQELEAFSYSVSHDLRAPLRAMQGFSQALMEDYAEQFDSVGQEYARRIVAAAGRMELLIQDLLAYSRLSRAELQLRLVDLESVIEDVMTQLEVELREKQAEVVIEEPLPQVMGHRITLVQVVVNLLANAIKFVATGVKSKVRVYADERGSWVRLWIEDNGIGIAPDHQERIFRVFERLHGIETYPGTGIGLAIVRKGVERMGGRVGVESQLGQGSRFWVELPKGIKV